MIGKQKQVDIIYVRLTYFMNRGKELKKKLYSPAADNEWETRTSGFTDSLWFSALKGPLRFNKLTENLSTDVVVVGGGVAGMTTAYLLSNAGKRVALLDDGYIASGESCRTTAHITHALDERDL